jgi:hypothetical protein
MEALNMTGSTITAVLINAMILVSMMIVYFAACQVFVTIKSFLITY